MVPTVVVIPALNEEAALPLLFDALERSAVETVVVVDNGSTDQTASVATSRGAVVLQEPERGYGAACLKGLEWVRGNLENPNVVFLDADHPEDVAQIPILLNALETGSHLVMGVRIDPDGGEGNRHTHARLGNRVVLSIAHVLFGHRFRDLGPFRAMAMRHLDQLGMDDRNWGWTLQMQVRALRAGMTITEIPLPHLKRPAGRSKISGSLIMSVKVGLKMFWTLARERVRSQSLLNSS